MITVYGKDVCPQCKQVVSFLTNHKIDHKYLLVGKDVTKAEVDTATGRDVRSVPVILKDGIETNFDSIRKVLS
jgi:glutaredoxin